MQAGDAAKQIPVLSVDGFSQVPLRPHSHPWVEGIHRVDEIAGVRVRLYSQLPSSTFS